MTEPPATDPLAEAIEAAIWKRYEGAEPSATGLVLANPRAVAAVAAAVARTTSAAVVQLPPTNQAATPASFVLWLDASDGSVPTHDGVRWPDGTVTLHHRHFGYTTTHADLGAARQATHGKQGRLVWPTPVDRAAVLNAGAQHLYTALFPAVYNDMGQKAAEGVNRAVSELRRLAAEATPVAASPERANESVPSVGVDRAAALLEAASFYERLLADMGAATECDPRYWRAIQRVAVELRRMAAEAPATQSQQDGAQS
jgi:hypothetical protein